MVAKDFQGWPISIDLSVWKNHAATHQILFLRSFSVKIRLIWSLHIGWSTPYWVTAANEGLVRDARSSKDVSCHPGGHFFASQQKKNSSLPNDSPIITWKNRLQLTKDTFEKNVEIRDTKRKYPPTLVLVPPFFFVCAFLPFLLEKPCCN